MQAVSHPMLAVSRRSKRYRHRNRESRGLPVFGGRLLPYLLRLNGVDPATVGKILGHKDIETTMIYTHQTDEHLKKSIGKIDIR